jgi:hypothetical protein
VPSSGEGADCHQLNIPPPQLLHSTMKLWGQRPNWYHRFPMIIQRAHSEVAKMQPFLFSWEHTLIKTTHKYYIPFLPTSFCYLPLYSICHPSKEQQYWHRALQMLLSVRTASTMGTETGRKLEREWTIKVNKDISAWIFRRFLHGSHLGISPSTLARCQTLTLFQCLFQKVEASVQRQQFVVFTRIS